MARGVEKRLILNQGWLQVCMYVLPLRPHEVIGPLGFKGRNYLRADISGYIHMLTTQNSPKSLDL